MPVPTEFRALLAEEGPDGRFLRRIATRRVEDLPAGDLLIRVSWSSLNYKDALSASGNRGVTRVYPHQPGIDAAGVVAESSSPEFRPGAPVVVTGYDLGMNTAGGFGEYVRVPAGWVVPLPVGLVLRDSMRLGTAGFTVALAVSRLQRAGVDPAPGEILVTGASGGVGSLAVALLAKLGYRVVAATGKADAAPYLTGLGASRVIGRDEVNDASTRPLLPRRWAGVIDTVGGPILSAAIRSCDLEGAIAVCGNAASPELNLTVFPMILRGISLLGVDSANTPQPERRELWRRLANEWRLPDEMLGAICREVALDRLEPEVEAILKGGQRGRVLVKVT